VCVACGSHDVMLPMAFHSQSDEFMRLRWQEFPAIRFRAAKPNAAEPLLEARSLVAQRVAIEIHDHVLALQKSGVLPATGAFS